MTYSLFYFDEVATDLKEARNWYRNKNKKLENRFTLAIKKPFKSYKNNQPPILFVIKIYVLQLHPFSLSVFIFN